MRKVFSSLVALCLGLLLVTLAFTSHTASAATDTSDTSITVADSGGTVAITPTITEIPTPSIGSRAESPAATATRGTSYFEIERWRRGNLLVKTTNSPGHYLLPIEVPDRTSNISQFVGVANFPRGRL